MAEVTVARIVLATPHRDLITLRANRAADGRIRYRMIHESPGDSASRRISIHPTVTRKPLSFSALVELIDGAYYEGACSDEYDQECYGRVIWGTLRLHFEHGAEGADEYLDFVSMSSDEYPQLQAYYRERVAQWCLDHCQEEEGCGKAVRMALRRG